MPPASAAPRLPASMIPGPPPVQTTPSRLPVASARTVQSRANSRASS